MPTPPKELSDNPRLNIRKRKSMVARTALQMLGKPGAMIGLAWVVLVALLAIIAPLIASSHPIAWKVDGEWSSPMYNHFTPVDVILLLGLLLGLLVGLILIPLRMFAFKPRVSAWIISIGLITPIAFRVVGLAWYKKIHSANDAWTAIGFLKVGFACLCLLALLALVGLAIRALVMRRQPVLLGISLLIVAVGGLPVWYKTLYSGVSVWMTIGLLKVGFACLCLLALLALVGLAIRALVKRRQPVLLGISLLIPVVVALVIHYHPISPPNSFNYRTYRDAIVKNEINNKEVHVDKVYFTLIPYSPSDRLRDSAINTQLIPPGARPSEEDVVAEIISTVESRYEQRTYDLVEPDGSIAPVPRTFEQARAISQRLWVAHQESEEFDPLKSPRTHESVNRSIERFENTQLGERFHLMGTTVNGEDLASRMIHACRVALSIGLISTSIAVFLGVIFGGLLGYFAGWADMIGLRLVEVFASIPVIMLLIMIVAFYGRNLYLMMVVLGLTGWVGYAYFIRAEFLKLRKMDYVMAARATGAPLHKILFQHMLPNGVAPILVAASFGIAGAIRTEATLSFIGLGLVEEPSWGQMLNQALAGGAFAWWLATYPGLAIFLTIFAYNLIGEALRDVIDPRAVK